MQRTGQAKFQRIMFRKLNHFQFTKLIDFCPYKSSQYFWDLNCHQFWYSNATDFYLIFFRRARGERDERARCTMAGAQCDFRNVSTEIVTKRSQSTRGISKDNEEKLSKLYLANYWIFSTVTIIGTISPYKYWNDLTSCPALGRLWSVTMVRD